MVKLNPIKVECHSKTFAASNCHIPFCNLANRLPDDLTLAVAFNIYIMVELLDIPSFVELIGI
jgi:hypothetical protein